MQSVPESVQQHSSARGTGTAGLVHHASTVPIWGGAISALDG